MTVAADADAEATGAVPDAKDGEAGGGEVDKLIPSFFFVKSIVSFLLTLIIVTSTRSKLSDSPWCEISRFRKGHVGTR